MLCVFVVVSSVVGIVSLFVVIGLLVLLLYMNMCSGVGCLIVCDIVVSCVCILVMICVVCVLMLKIWLRLFRLWNMLLNDVVDCFIMCEYDLVNLYV